MNKVAVAIVNYNTSVLTVQCLASLSMEAEYIDKIYVVDNASSDGSVKEINKFFEENSGIKGEVIENKKNFGFAHANNQVIRKSESKYILLLNSDTKVSKGIVKSLLEFAIEHPDAAVIVPKLLNTDGSPQKSVRKLPTLARAIKEYWLGIENEYEYYAPKGNDAVEVECASAAAFFITPKGLAEVGELDESYFFYFEDVDYCRRVKQKKLKIYYLPYAKVVHLMGESGKEITDAANQWRRLVPGSIRYHGMLKHKLIYLATSITRPKVKKILSGNIFWLVLISLFSVGAIFQLLKPGYFYMQDDLQAFRIQQLDKCITDFQIPCRWVPDAGYRYGYPQFNFYPPLVYYLGEAVHKMGFQFIDSVKIMFVLGYLLSSYAMYFLVRRLTTPALGFVSAILFTYVPYKALEVYVRGALSEFWALIFFPLIFLFIFKVIKEKGYINIICLSLSLAGLITTHFLSTLMFAIPALIWAIYWLYMEKKWDRVKHLIISGILGVGLSAFYLLPVIFERKFVHMDTLLMGYFDWRKHFVGLFRLLISREWGYGSSGFPDEKLNISTGLVQWVGAILAGLIALVGYKKNKKIALAIIVLLITELATLFIIHPRSNFIWEEITALQWLQFPWRFLAVSIFILSVIVGLSLSLISKKYAVLFGTLLVFLSIIINIGFFKPREWYQITDGDKFSGESWEKQLTISIFDYLPIYALLPPIQEAPQLPEVLEGKVEFENYQKGSDFQKGKLTVYEDAVIRLPLFDFPGMRVIANGEVIAHKNNDCRKQEFCLGLITFSLPKGEFSILVELTNTKIRTLGNFVTVISIFILIFLPFKYEFRKKT